MSIDTIIIDNYKIELELLPSQINIKLTDNKSYSIYEGQVNEDDIYIKPIKKFYSMIIKSLNKEPNYKYTIHHKDTRIIFIFSYNTEMFDVDENIIFYKNSDSKTIEILNNKIKELELKNQNLELKNQETIDDYDCKIKNLNGIINELEDEIKVRIENDLDVLPKSSKTFSDFNDGWLFNASYYVFNKDEYIIDYIYEDSLNDLKFITNYGKILIKIKPHEDRYSNYPQYIKYDFKFKITNIPLIKLLIELTKAFMILNLNPTHGGYITSCGLHNRPHGFPMYIDSFVVN